MSRLGGDEFVVLLAPCESAQSAVRVATKIIERISAPIALTPGRAQVSCSIGISMYPKDGDTADALLSAADSALYAAKRDGRGRCAQANGGPRDS